LVPDIVFASKSVLVDSFVIENGIAGGAEKHAVIARHICEVVDDDDTS
jgi:hypothetical protein